MLLKFDEGPCFNWAPSEVKRLSEKEVSDFHKALELVREECAKRQKPGYKPDDEFQE